MARVAQQHSAAHGFGQHGLAQARAVFRGGVAVVVARAALFILKSLEDRSVVGAVLGLADVAEVQRTAADG